MTSLALIPLFIGNLRGWEWLIILIVFLLLFGGKKIPSLMRNVGKSIRGLKEGMNDIKDEINRPLDDDKDDGAKPSDAPRGSEEAEK